MLGIRVAITRYISDEPQPGIVECEFVDAHGSRWTFIEKTAVVSDEDLTAETTYPRLGVIAGEVVRRSIDAAGREVIVVDTERPWWIESIDGVSQFDVRPELLLEWEWGSKIS